jgi:hypothetical protein
MLQFQVVERWCYWMLIFKMQPKGIAPKLDPTYLWVQMRGASCRGCMLTYIHRGSVPAPTVMPPSLPCKLACIMIHYDFSPQAFYQGPSGCLATSFYERNASWQRTRGASRSLSSRRGRSARWHSSYVAKSHGDLALYDLALIV